MFFIVGLGNPGKEYEKTRHNVGFMVLDMLEKNNVFSNVHLLKPKTYMNNSGNAVKKALSLPAVSLSNPSKGKLEIKNLIVVHDDIDIPLGKIKVSMGRGSAGHKGVESIIKELGTKNFTRIRIGIQPTTGKPKNVEEFVLKNFSSKELLILKQVITQSIQSIHQTIAAAES